MNKQRSSYSSKPILSIVIPALNEERTISLVIKDAYKNAYKLFGKKFEIIVADNGSTDKTISIVKKLNLARIISVPVRGYGAALHWGILGAKSSYVLFADADFSYRFSNLDLLWSKAKNKKFDLILGSRINGQIEPGSMPWLNRHVGTPILTLLIRLIYKIPTTDCNSGMRIVNKGFYSALNMRNSGMEWASELLIKTALKGGTYCEVPIQFNKDARGKSPHLSRWSDGWRHLKAILLLKPTSLIPISITLPIFGYLFRSQPAMVILFSLLTLMALLVFPILALLGYAIEGKESLLSNAVIKLPIVYYTILFSILVISVIAFVPSFPFPMKTILAGVLALIYIWIFFIETIKTHLINRLPPHI